MVQKYGALLKKRFPAIHYLLGSGDVEKILDAVKQDEGEHISSARSYLAAGEIPRLRTTPEHYAYLKIAEGCKKRCAFCIIPTIKGPLQSKPTHWIIKEFQSLLKSGVFEVVLIAQDLGDYGKDRGEKRALANLLRKMLEQPQDFWLRLLYLYPDEIDQELIDIIASDPRICNYVDMPIQHISDQVLKRMHRKTSAKDILQTIENLHKKIPNISIRTSLMVGYPGETEQQFAELAAFLEKGMIDHVGVFTYSREKESYSDRLQDHLPEKVKKQRYNTLMTIQQQNVQQKNRRLIGKKIPILVEGYHPDSTYLLAARHQGQAPEVDGLVILNDFQTVNRLPAMYNAKIQDTTSYDLIAKTLSPIKSSYAKTKVQESLPVVNSF